LIDQPTTDPLSVAASIITLVGVGCKVSQGLKDVVETWKNAPQELSMIALRIRHMTVCLSSACSLLEEHGDLFRDQLLSMLNDIHWPFKPIQDTIAKCLRVKKRMMRLKWLLEKRRVVGFVAKLEGLKTSLG
jgi:hypothetical protein